MAIFKSDQLPTESTPLPLTLFTWMDIKRRALPKPRHSCLKFSMRKPLPSNSQQSDMYQVAFFVLLASSFVTGRSTIDPRELTVSNDIQFRETAASLVLDNSVAGSKRIVETDNSIFRDLENRSSNVVAQLWQTMSTSSIFSLIRSIIAPLIASVTKLISHVATNERVKNFLPRSYYGYGSFDQSSLVSVDWFALGQNVFNILTKGQ